MKLQKVQTQTEYSDGISGSISLYSKEFPK